MRRVQGLFSILIVSCLVACGGGGGGGGTTVTPPSNNGGSTGGGSTGGGTTGGGTTGGGTTGGGGSGGTTTTVSGNGPFIVVDQFGYLPEMQKIAVLRDPQTGFDADDEYQPADTLEVVDTASNTVVMTGSINAWKDGATDSVSGDKVWHFDFSALQTPGSYVIRDTANNVESAQFDIADDVYHEVLRQALRTFYYQRVGIAKETPFAQAQWTDSASHSGPLQDTQARLYSAANDETTERDVSGGWYDAGDYNKYTNWTADYVIYLLHMYEENPNAWDDNAGIPESSNGVADILDEANWGLQHLARLQNQDGSFLSIVGLDGASPPSAADGQSLYGSESTSATLTSAAAFALAANLFPQQKQDFVEKAEAAWQWAEANPEVTFYNNDASAGTSGLGAGQQEVDDTGRFNKKLQAAAYLFAATGKAAYKDYFEQNYAQQQLLQTSWSNPFAVNYTHVLLYFADLQGVSESVKSDIQTVFVNAMAGNNAWGAISAEQDPYFAYLSDYTWGSSGIKADMGNMFYEQILYDLGTQSTDDIRNVAARYVHYLHGVNPLGKVYLSNMGAFGAENSVDQFYHSWFADGSTTWDSVQDSLYGPAPGFLVGGANPSYDWDSCCPNNCGTDANNAKCGTERLSPPYGQPTAKSYTDFNDSWPVNSWSVTENSNGYQVRYLRLLSKFVQ